MSGTIYVLQNRVNGKCYVGQTVKKLSGRICSHKKARSPIGLAILKYGIDSFDVKTFPAPLELLDDIETELIRWIGCIAPDGYNLSHGGQQHRSFSEISRERMRLAHLGKKQSPEAVEKRIAKVRGLKRTPEQVAKMSEGQIGHPVSQETRRKLSLIGMGKPAWNKGREMGPEFSAKCSLAFRGRKTSDATKAKMSAAHKGRKYAKRRPHSDEYRRSMSERLRAVWAEKKAREVA